MRSVSCIASEIHQWKIDGISPRVLSEAVVRLEKMSLSSVSTEQAEAMFTAISENKKMKSKNLIIRGDLRTVSPEVFAKAGHRIANEVWSLGC